MILGGGRASCCLQGILNDHRAGRRREVKPLTERADADNSAVESAVDSATSRVASLRRDDMIEASFLCRVCRVRNKNDGGAVHS